MKKAEAIKLGRSGWWRNLSDTEVARKQLGEDLLMMPFSDYHKAVEGALNRPVWTHEFADPERLLRELDGDDPTPDDPLQHALDGMAATILSQGRDPDSVIVSCRLPGADDEET